MMKKLISSLLQKREKQLHKILKLEVNDHLIDHSSNFSYFRAYLNQNRTSAQEVKLLLTKKRVQ